MIIFKLFSIILKMIIQLWFVLQSVNDFIYVNFLKGLRFQETIQFPSLTSRKVLSHPLSCKRILLWKKRWSHKNIKVIPVGSWTLLPIDDFHLLRQSTPPRSGQEDRKDGLTKETQFRVQKNQVCRANELGAAADEGFI